MAERGRTPSDVYPCLFYDDAPAAIEWLGRAFGFDSRLVVPGDDGSVKHAELTFGAAVIMLASSRPASGLVSPRGLGALHAALSLFVADPAAHCERARAAGARILSEPARGGHGGIGYGAADPEGNQWYFADYRPGDYWS